MPSATEPAAPEVLAPPTQDLPRALGLAAGLLAGMYLAVRPAPNQFMLFTSEAGFAGLLAVLLALLAAARAMLSRPAVFIPERLMLAAILWTGLHLWGALRSPHPGAGWPQACDGVSYALLLLAGYLLARQNPGLLGTFTRALVAMAAVEAFAGLWQYGVDFDRMRRELAAGRLPMTEDLASPQGQSRLLGNNVFGTFVSPNSLAAYLLMGVWLLAGLMAGRLRAARTAAGRAAWVRLGFSILLLGALLVALLLTDSKGAWLACIAGAWFFAAQRLAEKYPRQTKNLCLATAAGIAAVLALLVLACAGSLGEQPFGQSMQIRFEYWKAAGRMIADHPLQGVGLGGFAEAYPYYKTALGSEVKDAHNDYLQLWAELGLAAPLAYLALWWLLLRGAPRANVATPAASGSHCHRPLDIPLLAGGLLGFAFMYAAFDNFSTSELLALLGGNASADNLRGAFYTLAVPLVFAAAMLFLRPHGHGAEPPESATDLRHGIRAAAGAVLVHQIVDFDLKAQAVMTALFLLGGVLYAPTEAAPESSGGTPPAPAPLERVSRLFVTLLAVALLPLAVYVPLRAGLPRANAEALETKAQLLAANGAARGDPAAAKEHIELRRAIARQRAEVAAAAPFDGNAWIALAGAYEFLQHAEGHTALYAQIVDCLREAERRRPLAAAPKAMLGNAHLRAAMHAARAGDAKGASAHFHASAAAFDAAQARYPLAPAIRLWGGDARLLAGDVAGATALYDEAIAIDPSLYDANTRLSAIFSDPRSSVFARHGFEGDVLLRLPARPAAGGGVLMRRLVALVWFLRQQERAPGAPAQGLQNIRREIVRAAETLAGVFPDATRRAHAAFLLAMACMLVEDFPQAERAWQETHRLQQESIRAGQPGMPPAVFDYYYNGSLNYLRRVSAPQR